MFKYIHRRLCEFCQIMFFSSFFLPNAARMPDVYTSPPSAMALCDMLTLIFPSPGLIYMYTLGNHYKPLTPISACHAYYLLNEVSTPYMRYIRSNCAAWESLGARVLSSPPSPPRPAKRDVFNMPAAGTLPAVCVFVWFPDHILNIRFTHIHCPLIAGCAGHVPYGVHLAHRCVSSSKVYIYI